MPGASPMPFWAQDSSGSRFAAWQETQRQTFPQAGDGSGAG